MHALPPAYISGTGSYLPQTVITNQDLEQKVETSDEWIKQRTGISERRRVVVGQEASSDLGSKAALHAIESAGLQGKDIDFILCATITPDNVFPSTACHIQRKINAPNAACLDISAACSGFPYALSLAHHLVGGGSYKNVLVIGSECLTTITDYTSRETCILFGDGAGAVVVRQQGEHQILQSRLFADGFDETLMHVPAGGSRRPASSQTLEEHGHFMHIQGQKVFQFAVKRMVSLIEDAIFSFGKETQGRVLIVPHQVNIRVFQVAQKKLQIDPEQIIVNLDKYGNTSAASIPIALDEAVRDGRIRKGDLVILVAFGAGLTWGSTVIRW